MARKQESPEVTFEKALAAADYEKERRLALEQLVRLREERLLRETKGRPRSDLRN